ACAPPWRQRRRQRARRAWRTRRRSSRVPARGSSIDPLLAQSLAQAREGSSSACLDGAQRPGQPRGNLRLAELLVVGERQHLAFLLGNGGERLLDLAPQLGDVDFLLRI